MDTAGFGVRVLLMTAALLLAAPVLGAPVTVNLTGQVSNINGAIAPDIPLSVGDAVSFTFQYDQAGNPACCSSDVVPDFGITYTHSGGTIVIAHDENVTSNVIRTVFLGTSSTFPNIVDFDNNGSSGAIQGPTFPTSDPNDLSPWIPLQMVLFMPGTPDGNSLPPLSTDPADYSMRFDWRRQTGSNAFNQSGVTTTFDSVEIEGDVPAPEPTTLVLLGAGLAGLGFGRRRKPH